MGTPVPISVFAPNPIPFFGTHHSSVPWVHPAARRSTAGTARGAAQRPGTGPWAQGPVPSRRDVALEGNITASVLTCSVGLARSSGSPPGDPGQVLDRIQVPLDQGWPGPEGLARRT